MRIRLKYKRDYSGSFHLILFCCNTWLWSSWI